MRGTEAEVETESAAEAQAETKTQTSRAVATVDVVLRGCKFDALQFVNINQLSEAQTKTWSTNMRTCVCVFVCAWVYVGILEASSCQGIVLAN